MRPTIGHEPRVNPPPLAGELHIRERPPFAFVGRRRCCVKGVVEVRARLRKLDGRAVPLVVIESPYRSLIGPTLEYIDQMLEEDRAERL